MKILLAESQPLTRAALRQTLDELCPQASFVEAAELDTALASLHDEGGFNVVLWGLSVLPLPLTEGRGAQPLLIVLSSEDTSAMMEAALTGGARGFIAKTAARDVMTAALRLLLAGSIVIPSDEATLSAHSRLTPRQRQVLRLLGQGKSNKEIGQTLGLTEGTVKLHVSAVLRALKVHNRTQAVLAAARTANLTNGANGAAHADAN